MAHNGAVTTPRGIEAVDHSIKLGGSRIRANVTLKNTGDEPVRVEAELHLSGEGKLSGTGLEIDPGEEKPFSILKDYQNISLALEDKEDFLNGAKETLGIPSRRGQVGPFSKSDLSIQVGEPTGSLVSDPGGSSGGSSSGSSGGSNQQTNNSGSDNGRDDDEPSRREREADRRRERGESSTGGGGEQDDEPDGPALTLQDVGTTRFQIYPEGHPQASSRENYEPQFQATVSNNRESETKANVEFHLGDTKVAERSKTLGGYATETIAKRVPYSTLKEKAGIGTHDLEAHLKNLNQGTTYGEVTINEPATNDGEQDDESDDESDDETTGLLPEGFPTLPAVAGLTPNQTTLAAGAALLLLILVV
jgi:hypothetical protein